MTRLPWPLPQPDRRSCGAASLVVARMLAEGRTDVGPDEFARQVLDLHRRLTSWNDSRGEAQLPWWRGVGTPPWAVKRELEAITGCRYALRPVLGRRRAYARMVTSAREQRPVVAYVGSRWLPRHVVLTVEGDEEGTWTYDPAVGRAVRVGRDRWVTGPVQLAGWDRWWGVVTPRPAARRTPA
ncbi:hypothetical protein DDE18_04105 [Nocardioides gansuensis]|uniref:Peptidase C39-like domain-containing protein n=1 Tax=Nocardioides gansuensis TaxID=2138300 RepID=A0A2T8FGG0_9ACTN|nr:hypothetical protein [Nocardioides gansuensis]PVG84784.1 hypothetical protein DDE18_04105 [Nocardioides gansuensis]